MILKRFSQTHGTRHTVDQRNMRYVLYFIIVILIIPIGFSGWAMLREHAVPEELAPTNGTFVDAGDVRLFVQTAGDDNNPPIIITHGMAAWSETWRKTIDVLADAGWYVVAVDMPPFGFSERPHDKTYWRESQAGRIAAIIDTLDLDNAVLFAHSYGSRTAFETAMRYPERIRALVTVDPALDGVYDDSNETSSMPLLSHVLSVAPLRFAFVASTMTNPLLAKKFLQSFMHKTETATDEVVAVYQMPGALKGSTRDFGHWILGFLRGEDTGYSRDRERYKNLPMPVIIIWGREDTTTPLSDGEALHAYIPNSELLVIDGVGHMPHIEDTAAFNELLVESLGELQ